MRRSREAATRLHPGRQPWVIGIRHYSPPCKGGVDARSRKCREATLVRADGVARSASPIGRSLKRRSAKSLGPEEFCRTDHPVCGASEASRLFINAAATPPFQGGECVRTETVCQFIPWAMF